MKKDFLRWLCFSGIIILFSTGCVLPTVTLQMVDRSAQGPKILFADDFSNTISGWKTFKNDKAVVEYAQGGLRLWVNQLNYEYWSTPGKKFNNIVVSVDASKIDGPDNNHYGLLCRYQNEKNYYAFLISSDGYYGIARVVGGVPVLLGHDRMVNSEVIQQGSSKNQIQATCRGNELSLLVNNQALLTVKDDQFLNGDVGIIAGTYDQPGVNILFDNFVAYQP